MKVVVDIETNSLDNPDKVWVIVCKDIDTNEFHIFRRVSDDREEAQRFRDFARNVDGWIGHNLLGFDAVHLNRLGLANICVDKCFDTLVASKLHDYSRDGHSIEAYGLEYGIPKGDFKDFSKYSKEMEDYCVRDVEICHHLYGDLLPSFRGRAHFRCLDVEQRFQCVVNDLHSNGFGFNRSRAESLLAKVTSELTKLDEAIHEAFPHRLKCIREISPVLTQHGTLHRKDFRWVQDGDLSDYNGGPFCRCAWTKFNPSSHKQIIEVLHQAGWKPVDRTKTYIEKRREEARTKIKTINEPLDIDEDNRYSWKINETNLQTLPANAPIPARNLARRILLESRRRTLTEWLSLVDPADGRIHGRFHSIGAWTHRMAHQKPNTANIPNSLDTQGKLRLYGAEMRALWCAPRNRLLVGVDAEGIQLRIFAHLIDDPEFTDALVKGKKDDKTDPHSLNQRIIGRVCKSRSAAKRFIYALLLGAGIGKLSEVLECSREDTEQALNRLLDRYRGWAALKETTIPRDSQRGYFYGLDGRKVKIYGSTSSERRHLAMSGYLQNGEAVIMKTATLLWLPKVLAVDPTAMLVNLVHDEWQTEVSNDVMLARQVAEIQAESLREVGEMFGLNCPLAGSYMNEGEYTIGINWKETH